MRHAFLGPSWTADEVAGILAATGLRTLDFRGREPELLEAAVDRLAAGRVVGWFHGRMELGPRALGARSLLADPRDPGMRDRLNHLVKKREAFRPFAPSVLLTQAREHLDLDHPSRRLGTVDEIAAAVLFLCSPAARFITGSALLADGGELRADWHTEKFFPRGSL